MKGKLISEDAQRTFALILRGTSDLSALTRRDGRG
jgi:hypothetical protein